MCIGKNGNWSDSKNELEISEILPCLNTLSSKVTDEPYIVICNSISYTTLLPVLFFKKREYTCE